MEKLKRYMKTASEQGRLPRYGVPDRYEFVMDILRTRAAKLDKKVMRRIYQ